MNAEELQVVCDAYEKRISWLDNELDRTRNELWLLANRRICISHGGHEFIDKGPNGAKYKECHYCYYRPE